METTKQTPNQVAKEMIMDALEMLSEYGLENSDMTEKNKAMVQKHLDKHIASTFKKFGFRRAKNYVPESVITSP